MQNYPDAIRKQKLVFTLFTFTPLFLAFLLPFIFFKFPLHVTGSDTLLANHMVYKAMGMAMGWFFLLGCTIVLPRLHIKTKSRPWSENKLIYLMILFTIIGLIYHILNISINFPMALRQLLLPFLMFPLVTIVMGMYLRRSKQAYSKSLLWFLFFVNFVLLYFVPLIISMSFEAVYSLVALAFAYTVMSNNKGKSAIFIIVCLCLIAANMMIKNMVRDSRLARFYTQKHLLLSTFNPKPLMEADYQIFTHPTANTKPPNQVNLPNTGYLKYPAFVMNRVVSRLDHLSEFAYVLTETPSHIPFWSGKTYQTLTLQYMFVPRFLWHNKPIINVGQLYGHEYHYIGKHDLKTSWQVTLPVEAWINYGWTSFILSAIIFGLLINFLWEFFVGQSLCLGNVIFASIMVYIAAQGETDATTLLGMLLHGLLFYWVLDFIVRYYCNRRIKEESHEN